MKNGSKIPKTNIEKERLEKRMTQKAVADAIGVTEKVYREYESGAKLPKAEFLISLSKLFGVSCDYLLGLTDYKIVGSEEVQKITGLSGTALDVLLPHSSDWQIYTLNMLLENYLVPQKTGKIISYHGFLNVLSSIHEYLRAFAIFRSEKERYDKESNLIQHDLKGIDTASWDFVEKALDAMEKTRTISDDKIREDEKYLKALRLDISESLMRTVDGVNVK